jgi:hypothetical protein
MVEQEKKNQPVLTSLVNVGMKKWNPSVHHPSGLVYWWVPVHSGHMVHVQNRALHSGRVFWGHVHNSVPCNRGTMYNPTPWSWSLRNSLFKSCSLLILFLVAEPATNEAARNGVQLVDCCKLHFFLALRTKARILCLDSL